MRNLGFTMSAIVLLTITVLSAQLTLEDIIPTSKWQKMGLYRLTDSERNELKNEIISLITKYRRSGIAVIAPSISTQRVATQVLVRTGKTETISFRDAEAILVVVRSYLYNPLNFSYDSLKELKRDAEMQLNLTGAKYHVYLYSLENDLTLRQLAHESFEARKD